jgi:hypothetical protein
MLLFIALLIVNQDQAKKSEKTSMVMPFMKIETIGVNPVNQDERIFFKKNCAEKIMRDFKQAPVYLVSYADNKTTFEQVGTASCVFMTDDNKWLSASIDIKSLLPKGYVLRAHTASTKNNFKPDKTLEVFEASVIEFYLKPEENAIKFK